MSAQAELDDLLNTDAKHILDFERQGFDRASAPFQDALVLFGAGNLGQQTLVKLRTLGIEPLAFADNSPARQGTEIQGVRVLSVEDAVNRYNERATFVPTI